MTTRSAFMTCAAALLSVLPLMAGAVTLDMPANAALRMQEVSNPESYDMPTGPWTPQGIPVLTASGELRQQAWRINAAGLTTQQLLAPLRAQLEESGFEVLFTCATDHCGGFDFRFGTRVLPAPDMHVDLGDFRYLAAAHSGNGQAELISLLVSRTPQAGFVQIIRIGAPDTGTVAQSSAPVLRSEQIRSAAGASGAQTEGVAEDDLAHALDLNGRFVLSDLSFDTGSAQLGSARFASLDALADYMRLHPERSIALVGHTDSVGALDVNIALSKRRAGSVLERLATEHDIPRRRMEAEGMGYLSPVATNLTEEPREANRRVEVIITSVE